MSGFLVVQLLIIGVQLYDREHVLHRAVGGQLARYSAVLINLMDESSPIERRRFVEALDGLPIRLSLDQPWGTEASPQPLLPLFMTLLQRDLQKNYPLRIEVTPRSQVGPTPPWMKSDHPAAQNKSPGARKQLREWLRTHTFLLQARLTDGTVLTLQTALPDEFFTWPYRLFGILLVMIVLAMGLAWRAVRSLTHPLTVLAQAATELGRNIYRPPLPETGPLEVRRAAQAFNTMQAHLIGYLQDRHRILAAVSHDLKTPITRLRLRTELLEDATLRAKLQADVQEMEAMVQATLDFMRFGEPSEPIVALDLNALLESLQADAHDLGQAVSLQGSVEKPFYGRPLALKRALTNLIENAVRYGQRADIAVTEHAPWVRIAIRDHGPGIPENQLEQVFEPFYRLEVSRSRHTGGTGLGLSIARTIVRMHGGDVIVRNHPDGGLEAIVEVPMVSDAIGGHRSVFIHPSPFPSSVIPPPMKSNQKPA